MKNTRMTVCGAILLAMALPVAADPWAPSHSCIKPYKPYQFESQWEVDSFNDAVRRYKRCISDFVEEQNDAIEAHQQAADDAIDEWNSYVNFELN